VDARPATLGGLLLLYDPASVTSTRRWPAYLLLIFLFVVWSNSFVAARVLVGEQVPADQRLEPLPFVVARFLPVALVTWPWLLLSRRRRGEVVRLLREHGPLIVVLGVISVWVYNLPFAAGQRLVPPGAASLIITLNPVLTFLLAVGLRVERFAAVRAAGLALAFAGVWQVVVHGAGREVHGAYLTDALLLTLSPLSWALYTVLGKRLLGVASPLLVTYLTLALASAPTIPIALADAGLRATVARWPVERWAAALFLGLACTLLGYWLWNVALRRLPATTVASFVFLNPPLAILFEWLWLGNAPTWGLLLGGALVLAGVRLCLMPDRGARGATAIAPVSPASTSERPG
jgi:drug/metabolite transporter (DMT)-like permease